MNNPKELTVAFVRDVIARTISVMREQRDENGEEFAASNDELYEELNTIKARLDDRADLETI